MGSKEVIEEFFEERKKEKSKAIIRAEALSFIFDISLAIGVPFDQAVNSLIRFGEQIKEYDRRTI